MAHGRDTIGVTHISTVNIDNKNGRQVRLQLQGASLQSVSGRILSSPDIHDHNSFDQPEKIKSAAFTNVVLKNGILEAKLRPASVVVLELK